MNKASASLAWEGGHSAATAARKVGDYRRLRLKLYALLFLADVVAMGVGFLLADLIRFGRLQGYGFTTFVVMFPIYVAVALNGDAWSIQSLARPRQSAASASRALVLAIAVASIIFFSLKIGADFSRLVFGIGSCVSLVLIAAERVSLGQAIGRRYGWTFCRDVLLSDDGKEGLCPDVDDPASLDRLARLLERSERAIVSCPPARRRNWARALAGANIDVEILAPELGTIGAIGLRRHEGVPTLLVGCGPLPLRSRALKRLLDLTVAGAGLLLLTPLMVGIALAVRLESHGPALFAQTRVGRGNRQFRMLKFRTMRCDAADLDGARSASRSDDRVTRVGRFLRRTSLDELPQLINVISGEMSIVGPRPHALGTRAENRLLWDIDGRYWDRHAIKPGVTGLAQVRGFRGMTLTTSDLTYRLQSDLEYIDGWHIGRDLAIIARTIGVLVHQTHSSFCAIVPARPSTRPARSRAAN